MYDSENRPTGKTYSDGTPSVYYSYDRAGNKTEVTDGAGTTRYAYDAAGQRVSALTPKGSFLYSYDAAGNLTSRTYPNNLKTVYSYNDADEMVTAKVGKDITYYNHDADGNLASILHPNGVLDTRSYDAAGKLTTISSTDPKGKPFYSRSYTYDPVGNPLTLVATTPREHSKGWWGSVWRHQGVELARWTENYSYDARDRLIKACMSSSCHHYYAYSYDAVGNRTALETKKGTTTYAYDAADELLSTSKLKLNSRHPDVTTYSYDLSGNQTRSGDRHFAYNLENKLLSAKGAGKQVSYTYTGDGLMASRDTPSESTAYVWDTSSDLGQLALETSSKGKQKGTQAYSYGVGPIGIVTSEGSYSYHTDSLGSVVELSDSSARSLESYRYSAYGDAYAPGNSDQSNGNFSNPIRFTGQYLDMVSDLYNMRAREYEPETGRFLQVDPIEAGAGETYLGVYIYADDQPTVKTDPSGMCVPSGDSSMSPCMNLNPPKPKKKARPKLVYPFLKGVPKKLAGGPHFLHDTGQLPGYPALDFGAPAGTRVLAVASGTTWWESGGTSPSIRPEPHSVYGWTFYLKSSSTGIKYFYSHLLTRLVKDGPPRNHVSVGQVVGTLINWHQWGGVDHLHLGATGPASGAIIKAVFAAPQVKLT